MAISLKSVKCPDCGAGLSVEEGQKEIFCSYCGAKVMVVNENEHVYRHIDEAELKQAETDRMVRLKELEIAEQDRRTAEKTKSLKMKASIALIVLGVIMMVLGFTFHTKPNLSGLAILGILLFIAAGVVWKRPKAKK